jgi:hypothetical protein
MAAPDPRQYPGWPAWQERLDHGQLRASTADKEQVVRALQDAFLEGRLTQDEHADRVGQALSARTYADLDRLTADLPVPPLACPVPRMLPAVVPASRPVNRMAITALVLALLPGVTSAVGLVLGLIARGKIRADGGRGLGLANAAVLLGALFTALSILSKLHGF